MTNSRHKHIGLNAHLLSRRAGYRSAGIHTYIFHLLRHLISADPNANRWRYTIYSGQDRLTDAATGVHHICESRWPTERPSVRIAWEQLVQPHALRRANVDLLHGMAFVLPLLLPCPGVVTVHDLSFFHFPDRFQPAKRLYLKAMSRLSCRRARRIIAVSQATADDVSRLLRINPAQIDVIPHGVDHERFYPTQTAGFAKDLPARFILFVGTLEPRKNLPNLIKAFAQVRAQDPEVKLVIAGGKGWYYQEIFEQVERSNLSADVIFPGFVHSKELPLWYNSATMFVYPSIYEGFGLPLLEAMACGTPVIAANASCLPEVVGDAGLLAAPDQPEAIAQAMLLLLHDADKRADLAQRGRQRALQYTWQASAAATIATYQKAFEG